ncbi:hypothetical protein BDR07DRAFT_370947 [Suillus spraguei]|nr:hypothetical protein BDR07DRAFT_370947 [Suillus spraguei]
MSSRLSLSTSWHFPCGRRTFVDIFDLLTRSAVERCPGLATIYPLYNRVCVHTECLLSDCMVSQDGLMHDIIINGLWRISPATIATYLYAQLTICPFAIFFYRVILRPFLLSPHHLIRNWHATRLLGLCITDVAATSVSPQIITSPVSRTL